MASEPKLEGFGPDSRVVVESLNAKGKVVLTRETTIRKELEAALVVSNNDAYNFLYDLAGRDALNRLWLAAGLKSVHISHKLSATTQGVSTTERIRFLAPGGAITLSSDKSAEPLPPLSIPGIKVSATGEKESMDFSGRNYVSMMDLMRMCAWIADPALAPDVHWPGTDDDRKLVRDTMNLEAFDWALYRPLRAGLTEAIPGDDLNYIGKPGQAYGFSGDVAYVESKSTGKAFLVGVALRPGPQARATASRRDQHFDDVGTPFFLSLGDRLGHELLR